MRREAHERSTSQAFDRFVTARWPALLHLARLLTGGDRHRAEDLLQEALVKLWFAWPRVAEQAPEAYVRKVLARAAARSARRRWWGEQPVAELPEPPGAGDETAAVDERSRLEAALALLPARQRAAVVLRYYQDLPERDVARVLGCPVGTARSLTARGVARLRGLLTVPSATTEEERWISSSGNWPG
ncbi:SigE family RNA polymerase sigma factor [Streptomyces sp. NPDC088812]|uniref:SigE family RNA polymerase sigma factor n=1 Tax=Streptomyces sp. NPDC088812 TaxID=3365905 RepID=UPI00381AC59C